jgi:hypothetical protein
MSLDGLYPKGSWLVPKMVKIRFLHLSMGMPLRRVLGNSGNSRLFSKLKEEIKTVFSQFRDKAARVCACSASVKDHSERSEG